MIKKHNIKQANKQNVWQVKLKKLTNLHTYKNCHRVILPPAVDIPMMYAHFCNQNTAMLLLINMSMCSYEDHYI